MLKDRTWKRIAAGLVALALSAPATAVNVGDTLTGGAGLVVSAAETQEEEAAADAAEAGQDDVLDGGWEFSDVSADNIGKAELAAFDEALQGVVGVTYEPKDVIATQVVAGKNLAFLCKATPATLSAKSYWTIVSVYVDLQGKATLNHIAAIDPADLKVKEATAVPASGSWASETKENAAALPESVQKAFGSLMGVSYAPIAILGTQVVAGTNYCILTYGSLMTANPVTGLYAVYVYEKPDGTAEINAIASLDLEAYVTPAEEETAAADLADCTVEVDSETGKVTVSDGETEIPDTEYSVVYEGIDNNYKGEALPPSGGKYAVTVTANEDSTVITGTATVEFTLGNEDVPVAGGWEFSDLAADNVTDEEKAFLTEALQGTVGVAYEAKDVIATQVVAGKNLAFLCKATPTVRDPKPYWAIVSVYVDPQGKPTLNRIAPVDLADIKVTDNSNLLAPGSWTSEAKENTVELPESVQKAAGSLMGVSYSPIAVLGTQVVAGTNYRVLAYGTIVTAEPITKLYVANVYEKPDGTAEITSLAPLDLEAYVTPEAVSAGAADLADCTVDVDSATGKVTVSDGETEIPDTEYSVVYEGIDNDYKGEEVPASGGKYKVHVIANSDSTVVTGTAAAEFTFGSEAAPVSGGWEFADIAADNVSDAEKAALEEALNGVAGVNYEPKDVIATQVVAGKNLAFLCKATPVVRDPKPYWAIVSVYVDTEGKATLNNIAALDPADVKVKEGTAALAPGSWTSEAKENTVELPESVQKAASALVGVSYSPIAILGTQVVAGMNYCILTYGTLATAQSVTGLYVAKIYEKPDGTAEITSLAPLDIEAYVTPAAEETVTIDLADCKVDVNTTTGAVKVYEGDVVIAPEEYTLSYEGVNVDFIGDAFPEDYGIYKVTVTAKEDSSVVTGTVSQEFKLAEKDYFADADRLAEMSVKDYEQKHQDQAVETTAVSKDENGMFSIELKDSSDAVLDVYTIDPVTGTGKDQNGETVDLPQTGNTSAAARNIVLSALMMMTAGAFAVLRSGLFRRKRGRQRDAAPLSPSTYNEPF